MKIKIYRYLKKTRVEGPGIRTCIWVQGCSKHCKGCMMSETWDYDSGYIEYTSDIICKIKNTKGIEGVTFVGGEPFDQAKALYEIGKEVKKLNLTVVTFTGYLKEQIDLMNDKYCNKLRDISDILIDGPFIESKKDFSRPWIGSSNQRYFFMTGKYKSSDIEKYKNKVEVRLNRNGLVQLNGMGDFNRILNLMK